MSSPEPVVRLRLSAYAVVTRGDRVLLTRISSRGHHTGDWTLPGGGIDHGEPPRVGVVREVREETGLEIEVGEVLDVHDAHFTGHAPDGTLEDFHGVHLIFAASTPTPEAPLCIVEVDGTTDGVSCGTVYGTTLHGLFEGDGFRHEFLRLVARRSGKRFVPGERSYAAIRETRVDALADLLEAHVDLTAIFELIALGASGFPIGSRP
jgi:ADP-ribose pyrophosphatase YjhB (NUDIX family)